MCPAGRGRLPAQQEAPEGSLGDILFNKVAVALEAIRADFNVSVVLAGWVIAIYQLGLTISMPTTGKVSDVLGRKPTFMLCVLLFVFGSLGAALSPDMPLLIASRFVQALGAGGLTYAFGRTSGTVWAQAAGTSGFSDYKALVCVFLFGGNDSWSMVVPP